MAEAARTYSDCSPTRHCIRPGAGPGWHSHNLRDEPMADETQRVLRWRARDLWLLLGRSADQSNSGRSRRGGDNRWGRALAAGGVQTPEKTERPPSLRGYLPSPDLPASGTRAPRTL